MYDIFNHSNVFIIISLILGGWFEVIDSDNVISISINYLNELLTYINKEKLNKTVSKTVFA